MKLTNLFRSQNGNPKEEPKPADETPADESEQQLDQLIDELKEENSAIKTPVEFKQATPKVMEWTETVNTNSEEEHGLMTRLHHIKIQENFAGSVLSGEKSFELRRNDRGYQKGDLIQFEVVNSVGVLVPEHELEGKKFMITYVLSGWGLQEGFVALAIKEVKSDETAE